MNKESAYPLVLILTVLATLLLAAEMQTPWNQVFSVSSLTTLESHATSLVNGTEAFNYALELEKIALNHSVSGYSFRSGGSAGATASALWIKEQFQSFGLGTSLESFNFTTWNMIDLPTLLIDEDGVAETTADQEVIDPFQSEHFSWYTPEGGVYADLVVLPLPPADPEIGSDPIDTELWDTIDTSGKIVLIGREVRWVHDWEQMYIEKLTAQPPAAVVYTWWYEGMSSAPLSFSSTGGRPARLEGSGPYYWNLGIPVGSVNYDKGLLIRDRESSQNISAKITIPSVISTGPHYNVVGTLEGRVHPEKLVLISGHYDSVTDAGFVDNAAGTAGVIELARVFSHVTQEGLYNSNYTFVFVAFASEELGFVGSVHYVKEHKAEIGNIVAVINLDCLGSDELNVARTEPGLDFDLDGIILKAANDLNIPASLIDEDSSDHLVFRNPVVGEDIFSSWWPGLNAGIDDAPSIISSTGLLSYPLSYSATGPSGWIHTPFDNSTSTYTLNWLEKEDLEEQIRVAALTVLRLSPSTEGIAEPFRLSPLIIGIAAVAVVAVATISIVYVVRVWKKVTLPTSNGNKGSKQTYIEN
jgi:hypothetical protein